MKLGSFGIVMDFLEVFLMFEDVDVENVKIEVKVVFEYLLKVFGVLFKFRACVFGFFRFYSDSCV